MGIINGMTKKQAAVHARLPAQNSTVRDAVLALEPVLGGVRVHALKTAACLLEAIWEETGADEFELSRVLSLVRASGFGDVLSATPVPVEVDDEARSLSDNIANAEGFLLEQDGDLAIFIIGRQGALRLFSAYGLDMWEASAAAMAMAIHHVFVSIDRDGLVDTRCYNVDDVELGDCDTFGEFANAESVVVGLCNPMESGDGRAAFE